MPANDMVRDALAQRIAVAVADAVADVVTELLADTRTVGSLPLTAAAGLDALPPVMPLWPTAGQFLGLSRSLTYDAARRGVLPTIRVGKKVLVSRDALAGWLTNSGGATSRTTEAAPVGPPHRQVAR